MTHGSKKLGRLVLGAILAAGAGFWTPSVASANDVFIDADNNDTVIVSDSGGPAPGGTLNPAKDTTDTKSLTITGGAWDGWNLAGGVSAAKELTGYSLTLNDVRGTNMKGIYGAVSAVTGNIIGNQLTLKNVDVAIQNDRWIAGGYSSAPGSKVQNNTLTIKSGKATGNGLGLVGGLGVDATDIDVTENHLVIEGGEVNGEHVGGGKGLRNAGGNTVEISGGTVKTVVLFGGYSAGDGSGNANGNKVTISGGTVDMSASANGLYGGYVFGGANTTGGASNNEVLISGGTVKGDIRGGRVQSGTGSATENKVTISNGSITADGVVGGEAVNGNAADNIVMISGGTTAGNLVGGLSHTGNATGNAVTISSGTVGTTNAHGVYGGESFNGAADNNIVTISGGTISGSVWGGNGKTATGNTVTISGGTFAADAFIHGAFANGAATNNTVNILTQIAVGGLAGGESMTDAASSTGNTLNLAATGVTTGDLYAFQNLNFYLPTNMSKTDTMLTVSGTAEVDGAKVGVMAQGKLANLAKDDKVTLLHANTLNGTVSQTTEIDVPESIAKVNTYEFNVTSDANNIYATITKAPEEGGGEGGGGEGGGGSKNAETRENTKSVVETKAATTTFVNAGADMLASQGFSEAANAVAMEMAESAKNGGKGSPIVSSFTPFAAFGGSSMRAESGSYVDTRGFGLNIGFARELSNAQGKLLFGPVVEYGGGNYDSYLDNGVHGEGGSHYFGVGIMARQVNRDGFYYEGSVRGGRVTSDYKGTFNLQNVNYDSSSNYWAAHLGIGKAFAVGGSNTLDGYVKYFYSHQAGDSVTMHTTAGADEDWNFDSVDSHRIRIGARLTHKINDKNSLYGGLAYQYEFGGEATAHYNGGSTPSPSVKGSSGMLELGWQVKPGEGPLTLDLGVTGWAGKQRGGSVQLGATWSF